MKNYPPLPDLNCSSCYEAEASNLLYWTKIYRESGQTAYTDPTFICSRCIDMFRHSQKFYERRPNIVSFNNLAKMDSKELGWLTSKKGKEYNMMSVNFWKKRLWRIRIVWQQRFPDAIS